MALVCMCAHETELSAFRVWRRRAGGRNSRTRRSRPRVVTARTVATESKRAFHCAANACACALIVCAQMRPETLRLRYSFIGARALGALPSAFVCLRKANMRQEAPSLWHHGGGYIMPSRRAHKHTHASTVGLALLTHNALVVKLAHKKCSRRMWHVECVSCAHARPLTPQHRRRSPAACKAEPGSRYPSARESSDRPARRRCGETRCQIQRQRGAQPCEQVFRNAARSRKTKLLIVELFARHT